MKLREETEKRKLRVSPPLFCGTRSEIAGPATQYTNNTSVCQKLANRTPGRQKSKNIAMKKKNDLRGVCCTGVCCCGWIPSLGSPPESSTERGPARVSPQMSRAMPGTPSQMARDPDPEPWYDPGTASTSWLVLRSTYRLSWTLEGSSRCTYNVGCRAVWTGVPGIPSLRTSRGWVCIGRCSGSLEA